MLKMYNIATKLDNVADSNQPEVKSQRRYQKTLFTENELKKDDGAKNVCCHNEIGQYLKKNRSENRSYIPYRKKLLARDLTPRIVVSQSWR
jgi:hypothetical protein